jgi:hypothetical protein
MTDKTRQEGQEATSQMRAEGWRLVKRDCNILILMMRFINFFHHFLHLEFEMIIGNVINLTKNKDFMLKNVNPEQYLHSHDNVHTEY